MKNYEYISRSHLDVSDDDSIVVRVDGRAFRNYTQGAKKPFDEMFQSSMNEVAKELCESIQGSQLGYVQSDEASIIIAPRSKENSSFWFDGNIQKICSISAAIASTRMTLESIRVFNEIKVAHFDARVFCLPKEEIIDYLIWRQSDIIRNSTQMLARSLFSQKQLNKKSCEKMKEMVRDVGRPWENEARGSTYGRTIIKTNNQRNVEFIDKRTQTTKTTSVTRMKWVADLDIPNFAHNHDYINDQIQKKEK